MSDGMGRESAYLSSHATNRYFIPNWGKDIEERMLAEILNPTSGDVHSLPRKIKRYFKNRWKYQLVYSKENHLMGFLLRIRSWVNWKWGKKSVWKN